MKMNKAITTIFAVLTLFTSAGVSAADSKSCQTACGKAFGKCIQINPDGYETACTPKRDACMASCNKQSSSVEARTAKRIPKSLAEPSKASRLFFEASQNKNYEMMDLFLKQGADINCENCNKYSSSWRTPLMEAADRPYDAFAGGGLTMVDFLLTRGAEVNYQNRNGLTALMLTSEGWGSTGWALDKWAEPRAAVIAKLIQAGANVNLSDAAGNKAIHYLANNDISQSNFPTWQRSMRLLLAQGANLNEKNSNGQTPLMGQARVCNLGVVEDLLTMGADPSIKSSLGETALSLVIEAAAKNSRASSCNQVVRLLSNPSSAQVDISMAGDSPDTKEKPASSLLDSLKKLNESMKKLGQQ